MLKSLNLGISYSSSNDCSNNISQVPIGVFDSGYGGLSILKELIKYLPEYDYLYLGDNARAPYGNRSFETVYNYTLECVKHLFSMGCRLVILACNTASAKALRTIQQYDLMKIDPSRRVLGIIRPISEVIGNYTESKIIGVFGTIGTVSSKSYEIEIKKFFPALNVYQEACPMWVPLIENNEFTTLGADYFVKKHVDNLLTQSPRIDTIILACTHYSLLKEKIQKMLPPEITLVSQGDIVGKSLKSYLNRHPEIDSMCSKGGDRCFFTTDTTDIFDERASIFFEDSVKSKKLLL